MSSEVKSGGVVLFVPEFVPKLTTCHLSLFFRSVVQLSDQKIATMVINSVSFLYYIVFGCFYLGFPSARPEFSYMSYLASALCLRAV
jgi:hypothetical protein